MTVSTVLTDDDKYLELAMSCRGFMVEAKKVDKMFVFEPVDPKNAEWRVESTAQLPINYTNLTAMIKVSKNTKFKKSIPRRRKSGGGLMKIAWNTLQFTSRLIVCVILTNMIWLSE